MEARYLMVFMLVQLSILKGDSLLTLTSQPQTSGTYCPGPVTFTCVGTAGGSLFWLLNGSTVASHLFETDGSYPISLTISPPLDDVTIEITSVSTNSNAKFEVTSVFDVTDASILAETSLQCEDTGSVSNLLNVTITSLPPSYSLHNCSLLPFLGGAKVTLQWSPSFTSQYAVERYRVSVNPDPSSCSSEQVSPSEDYSCSGLILGTLYTFTVSAINCGDQEGDREVFTKQIEVPSISNITTRAVFDVSDHYALSLSWNSAAVSSHNSSVNESQCVSSQDEIGYAVMARESNRSTYYSTFATSDKSCNVSGRVCSTEIWLATSNRSYTVSIHAVSIFGMLKLFVLPTEIAGESHSYFNFDLIRSNTTCTSHALCSSNLQLDGCTVQYTTDPSFRNLSPPVWGPINSPFELPAPVFEAATYFYQATVTIDDSLVVILQREAEDCTLNVSIQHCDSYDYYWYLSVIFGFLLIICIILSLLLVVWIVLIKKKQKPKEVDDDIYTVIKGPGAKTPHYNTGNRKKSSKQEVPRNKKQSTQEEVMYDEIKEEKPSYGCEINAAYNVVFMKQAKS